MTVVLTQDSIHIREVWNDNLESEFALIRDIVDDYPYIGMDTEFPGVALGPPGDFKGWSLRQFHNLIANVNAMKLIQLGLTFSNKNGVLPTCGTEKYCLWQFNFREFNLDGDLHAQSSIELLIGSGIDFRKNNEKGVDANRFGELLMSSGVVLDDDVRWLTFHGSYDFAYLLKLLTGKSLPDTEVEFSNLLRTFFPIIYDIKHLLKLRCGFHGGLDKIAGELGVDRIGTRHQAGSDSLLTCRLYMRIKEHLFSGCSPVKYSGVVYGLELET